LKLQAAAASLKLGVVAQTREVV